MRRSRPSLMNGNHNPLALLCAGQGGKILGAGKQLAASCSECRILFETADRTLGWGLSKMLWNGPEEALRRTAVAQPAVLTVSIAHANHLRRRGVVPQALAGHSLGQYSALVLVESLGFEDALRLVAERGRLMQETLPEGKGAMVAVVGLNRREVYEICDAVLQWCGPVNVACHNAPQQTVISGASEAVDEVAQRCEDQGAVTVQLPVSVPFHCDLLSPMVPAFTNLVATVPMTDPVLPVIDNVTAKPLLDANAVRRSLVAQITAPVLFEESLLYLAQFGIHQFIQCGPGDALVNFTKRTLSNTSTSTFEKALTAAPQSELA